jgi:hypothetical protein
VPQADDSNDMIDGVVSRIVHLVLLIALAVSYCQPGTVLDDAHKPTGADNRARVATWVPGAPPAGVVRSKDVDAWRIAFVLSAPWPRIQPPQALTVRTTVARPASVGRSGAFVPLASRPPPAVA